MRNILLVVGVTGLLVFFSACGGKDHPAALPDGPNGGKTSSGGRSSSGGKTGSAGKTSSAGGDNTGGDDLGGAGGAGPTQSSKAPVVKITEPTAAKTPDDGVLVDQVAHVVCTVLQSSAPGAAAVDAASVTLAINDASGKVIEQKNATSTTNNNEYASDFVLTTVASGPVSFTCSAQDKKELKQTDTISTFVDHGPKITVVTPEQGSFHPLKETLAVEFHVDVVPLAKADAGADVDQVTFSLDGKPIDLQAPSPGVFQAGIPINDTDKFPQTPSGAIIITASNKRMPNPVTTTKSYGVVVDGDGPVITIESPAPQSVVGGKIRLAFTVTDKGSGVDPLTVNVKRYLEDEAQLYDPLGAWTRDGDKYTYTFDSKDIEAAAKVQTTVNVRASDKVGNPSASGQSIQLYLDNVPPQIDLDPHNIRMRSGATCSGSFDPLGEASLNDLDGSNGVSSLGRFGFFRVFVNEQTNQDGQSLHYYAGTNQKDVRLYLQSDPGTATTKLLVNKNPGVDNTCDDIGGVDAMTNAPQFSTMNPLPKTGAVWNKDDPAVLPTPGSCPLSTAARPNYLCPSQLSGMWFIPYNDIIKEPFVYVAGTPNPADDSCTGIDLEFFPVSHKDGWVCAAARVTDNAGNVGISPPIRLCVDNPDDPGQPSCAISSEVPPSCTDGCTPPARGGNITAVNL